MQILDAYYNGAQPLRYATPEYRRKVRDTYALFSANFCKPVVQALEERLTVTGFRFGGTQADKRAWDIWQANQMDAQSQKAHREAIIKSDCPVIVGPPTEAGGPPIIRVQKPEEVVIGYGDDPLVRAVAMKRWTTPDKRVLATLYYPNSVEKYERSVDTKAWVARTVSGEEWPLTHDIGLVPVVALVNDPDLDSVGASEISPVIPLNDGLNKVWLDLLMSSEYAAFRQRWATGIDIPINPETKQSVEPFQASVNRVWSTAAPDAKFGDFEQTDTSSQVRAIDEFVREIAALTRTPYHYFLSHGGQPPSGESLRAAETGLVAKAKRRARDFGDAWEEIERLSFLALGDTKRGTYVAAETIWRDPEYRTESEHVDALVKLQSIGVPEEQLWADAGYTPTQISGFVDMRAREPQVPVLRPVPTKVPETATGPAAANPVGFAPPSARHVVVADAVESFAPRDLVVADLADPVEFSEYELAVIHGER
jgi:hypothetical protein